MLITKRAFLGISGSLVAGLPVFAKNNLEAHQYWKSFKSKFISRDGFLLDSYHKIVHSEGQGVALVLSAYFKDKETFYKILNWTENNLYNKDLGLYSWKWEIARGVTDPNNASDGDLYIYWGLVLGHIFFKDKTLFEKANKLQSNLYSKCIKSVKVEDRSLEVLLPGAYGFVFKDGCVVNLSYYVRPAFYFAQKYFNKKWKTLFEDGAFLASKSLELSEKKLVPNWISVSNKKISPWKDRPAVFGYDAIRAFLWFENLDKSYFIPSTLKAEVPLTATSLKYENNAPVGFYAVKNYIRGEDVKLEQDLDYYSFSLVLLSFVLQQTEYLYETKF